MNLQIASAKTLNYIKDIQAHKSSKGLSIEHAKWLLNGIALEYVEGEKAHRWLGWAQAIVCSKGFTTLEKLKEINKDNS